MTAISGANVVNTFGAVHSVTPARLAAAASSFARASRPCRAPASRCCSAARARPSASRPSLAASFGASLAQVARDSGGSLLVTPSRRTSPEALRALSRAIADVPHLVWDGTGENPYYAFLAMADAIVTTEDSVNMVTEAAGTGKPVFVQRLKGNSKRLNRFHELMRERGATRPFAGKLETWSYTPINDTEAVASVIRRALALETTG